MEDLCKITNSNYIACLKIILKRNQISRRGYPALLQKLKRKDVLKTADMFLLWLHLATIFVTIEHNVYSNTVRSLLRHEIQSLTLIVT